MNEFAPHNQRIPSSPMIESLYDQSVGRHGFTPNRQELEDFKPKTESQGVPPNEPPKNIDFPSEKSALPYSAEDIKNHKVKVPKDKDLRDFDPDQKRSAFLDEAKRHNAMSTIKKEFDIDKYQHIEPK